MAKDYLEMFNDFNRRYDVTLQTPANNHRGLYEASVEVGGVYICVGTSYLASTLYAFVDALDAAEQDGALATPTEGGE